MRALRSLLLSLPLCALGLAAAGAQAGQAPTAWSDLWHTPDQQGQALLDAGNPAAAAARFRDPRRRAYAELQAGRNQEAAKLLEPLTDAQSEYNRGNALAKAGQLQPALAAYDAALKQSPADEDIRHNRDLVERALKQQPPSPQSSRNGAQNGGKSGSSGRQQSGSGQQKGSGSQQSGAQGQQTAGGAPNDSRAGGNGADRGGPSPQQAGQANGDNSKEAPGQAQRDAQEAAALARGQQQGKPGDTGQPPGAARQGVARSGSKEDGKESNAQRPGGGMQTPRQKPESERQLALDQWLRQIPDSPAGLLQRKFLIEHMMKQQEGGEPQAGSP
jgi:Ca-activated chloride channel family protein